jgi:hypothetical protein
VQPEIRLAKAVEYGLEAACDDVWSNHAQQLFGFSDGRLNRRVPR